MADQNSTSLRRTIDACTVVCGVAALALLLIEFGFPITDEARLTILSAVRLLLWGIVTLQLIRAVIAADWRRNGWRCVTPIFVNGVLILLLALETIAVAALHAHWPTLTLERWASIYLTTLHVTVLVRLGNRLLNFNQLLAFVRISPRAILISSYVLLIIVGTLLLKLPNATTSPLGWLDALFTSTSAVCVTGLIVVDTATAFTTTGQSILLALFQLGGLGLMTFTYFFVSIFGSGITIRDRALLLEFLNEEYVGRVTNTLTAIILMTLLCEVAGVFLLHASTPTGDVQGWFASLFHSVSAFCNAGFSIYSAGLYDPLTRSNMPYQLVIMALIVVGGLGFPVLKNLSDQWTAWFHRSRQRPVRLTTHTKLVLVTTAGLIVGGALLTWITELPSGVRAGETPQWFTALFLSITARTAGFNTVPTEALVAPSVLVVLFLMFVGGSPASTAGGIKTTTLAVTLLNTIRTLRDPARDLVAFRRRISANVANRAFAVLFLALSWVIGSTLILTLLMPGHDPLDVTFEAVSAFSTVGLSRGLTAELPPLGKLVIIMSMLVGRIGILYVALGILHRDRPGIISYPEGNVIIS